MTAKRPANGSINRRSPQFVSRAFASLARAWWGNMKLCLQDLVELTGGELKLAVMPPLEGELTPIERIMLKPDSIESGDLFWCLAAERCDIELAFLRGAAGVVCSNWTVEPWPGRFVLVVDDTIAALEAAVEGLSEQLNFSAEEEFCD